MKTEHILKLLAFLLFSNSSFAANPIPLNIPYAGTVTVDNAVFDGGGLFKFAIVNKSCEIEGAENQCVSFWSNDGSSEKGAEPDASVQTVVSSGRFQVKLGDTSMANMTEISTSVFSHTDVYLRVWFNDGIKGFQKLSNDRQLVSMPYAYRAEQANGVASGSVGVNEINKSEVQTRVQNCSTGSSIREIKDDGSVVCETDNGDEYTAGSGIAINAGSISIPANGVSNDKIASVNWDKLQNIPGDIADGDTVGIVTETDPTVAANVKDGVSWHELNGIPADIADGDSVGIVTEADPTVAANVKDGVSWDELNGIPADIADGDNVGITAETDPKVSINTLNFVPAWNGSTLMTGSIYDNGNVGIGITDPDMPFSVGGVTKGDTRFAIFGQNKTTGKSQIVIGEQDTLDKSLAIGYDHDKNYGYLQIAGDKIGSVLVIADGEKVGIGTTTPSAKLEIAGNVNTIAGGYMDDSVCIAGTCTSDRNLKTNISALSNALDKIMQLQPVSFEFVDRKYGAGKQDGLIAQDVEQVFPEWVSENTEGNKTIKYGLQIQMLLIQALKELKNENDKLNERIKALEAAMKLNN